MSSQTTLQTPASNPPSANSTDKAEPIKPCWCAQWPLALLVVLTVLCLLWEIWLAPLRPAQNSLGIVFTVMILKVLPLLLAMPGFYSNRIYTYKWMSLAIWLFFIEGTVRGWSDKPPSSTLAWIEAALSVAIFAACVMRVRLLKNRI